MSLTVHDLDGVSWHEAPPPPLRHKHWAQTWGQNPTLGFVERCPCGAVRADRYPVWALVNRDTPRVAPRRTLRQIIAGLAGRK